MAKRRSRMDSDSEGDNSDHSRSERPPSRKKKAPREKVRHEGKNVIPETTSPKSKKTEQTRGDIRTNDEGEKYVDLGRKRRVTVRKFKGQMYVDIREYYGDNDEEKPGKKGISLSVEQYQVFKNNINEVDSLLSSLESRK